MPVVRRETVESLSKRYHNGVHTMITLEIDSLQSLSSVIIMACTLSRMGLLSDDTLVFSAPMRIEDGAAQRLAHQGRAGLADLDTIPPSSLKRNLLLYEAR